MSPARKRHGKVECLKVGVPKTACYVRFGGRTAVISSSEEAYYRTVRGDRIILDFDSEGQLLGLELLGDNQPCQKTIAFMEGDYPTIMPPMKDEK